MTDKKKEEKEKFYSICKKKYTKNQQNVSTFGFFVKLILIILKDINIYRNIYIHFSIGLIVKNNTNERIFLFVSL